METPINKAIKQFEELQEKAESLKDVLYLDGVLAVLENIKPYEKEVIIKAHRQGQLFAGAGASTCEEESYFENEFESVKD